MQEIFWRNLRKLFRGRVDFLPKVDAEERDEIGEELEDILKIGSNLGDNDIKLG